MEAQLTQLRTQAQYSHPQHWPDSGWGDSPPLAVTQSAQQMAEGVTLELPSYLSRESIQTTTTQTTRVPIYAPPTSDTSYEFLYTANFEAYFKRQGSNSLPAGWREVMGPKTPSPDDPTQATWGLVGAMFPTATSQNTGPVFVGWRTVVTTVTTTTYSDTAMQFLVQGTSANDVVRSSSYHSFRGVIETGQGDDSVMFWPEYSDTVKLRMGSYQQREYAPHGLGAWIDAGSGNDTVRGTDGEDVIIGGIGSDVLDGNGGADTYLVSALPGDVDYIKDAATADRWVLEVYGGVVNQDVVEFDGTVALADLSYQWSPQAGKSGLKTLLLFSKDQLFLQIDYWLNSVYRVGSGVEQFKFSDGTMLSVDALLGVLPVKTATPSTFVLDASVLASSLSYQWVASEAPGVVKLALFQNGQALVEFDYDSSVANTAQVRSLAGIVDFEFANGDVLTLQALLTTIHLEPALPMLGSPLPDLVATEDAPFTLAVPLDDFIDPQGRPLHFAASLQNGDALPSWLHFNADTGQLTGTPDNDQVGVLQILVTATNDAGLAISDLLALSVLNVNDAPVSATPLLNQEAAADAVWRYAVPAGSFVDVDAGDTLTYTATLANGSALPGWVTFDAVSQTFSGTPGSGDVSSLSLKVMATDVAGASASASFSVTVTAPTGPDPLSGNDALTADTSNTPLHGGAGNDALTGSWASSTLYGDSGDDVLSASGGPGNVLDGGDGDDTLSGGWGADTLIGGEGNNIIRANGGNSLISAGAGNDQITSSWGDDRIDAGDGNNIVNAGGGANTITSGSGNDIISADGSNLIHAGAGNDQIITTWGADNIDAGAGDDIIRAGGGGNTIRGGLGNDQTINDQWSDDRYLFARGDGQDVMLDGGGQDSLTLENVTSDQLWFSQNGNDLELSVIGTQDHITLQNWYLGGQYPGSQYHMEQFKTSDGKTLLDSQVQNLVSAMAGFAPPPAGQTTLSSSYAGTLAPVLAANWQ